MNHPQPPPPAPTDPPPSVLRALEVYLVCTGRILYRGREESATIGRIDSLPPDAVDRLVKLRLASMVTRAGAPYVIPTERARRRTAELRWSAALQHYDRGRAIVERCRSGEWVVVGDRLEVVIDRVRPMTPTLPTAFRELHERLDYETSPTAPLHPEPVS